MTDATPMAAGAIALIRAADDAGLWPSVLPALRHEPAVAADVVEELPSAQAEKILDLMEEEKSEEIQEILEYPEDSAGRLMSQDVVAIREAYHGWTYRQDGQLAAVPEARMLPALSR